MSDYWRQITIEELSKDVKGSIAIGPFGSKLKSNNYVSFGIPVIRGTNVSGSRALGGKFVYITEEKAKSLGNANVYSGDLVFPHRGAIGEVGLIGEKGMQHLVLSSSLMKLTPDKTKVDSVFLY